MPAQAEWVCVHGYRWTPADCLCDLTNVLLYHKDPVEQLQKLARQQSELLLQRLGGGGDDEDEHKGHSRDIPQRPVPFGSEGVISPTYVAQQSSGVLSPQPVKGVTTTSKVRGLGKDEAEAAGQTSAVAIAQPSYTGPGAAWEKGEDMPSYETPALATEEEKDVLET